MRTRGRAQDDRMLHMAHASRHHWEQVAGDRDLLLVGPPT